MSLCDHTADEGCLIFFAADQRQIFSHKYMLQSECSTIIAIKNVLLPGTEF